MIARTKFLGVTSILSSQLLEQPCIFFLCANNLNKAYPLCEIPQRTELRSRILPSSQAPKTGRDAKQTQTQEHVT